MPIPRFLTPLLGRFAGRSAPLVDLQHTPYIAHLEAHPAQAAPVLPAFPDFYQLADCRLLADTGKAELFVGRDPQGLQKVVKFCRFARGPEEDAPREEEMANAVQVSFAEAFFLPVDRVARACQHPRDPTTYGFAYQMPHCRFGSLADHAAHGFVSQHEIVALALSSLIPLLLLEEQGVAHGDVKPTNILYWSGENASSSMKQDGLRLVLADFGASVNLKRGSGPGQSLRQGTPRYCAPEALAGAPPTHADDIWAWATTVLELFLPAAIRTRPVEADRPIAQDDVPDQAMPAWLASTLRDCRQQSPDDRPSADAVLTTFMAHWEVLGGTGPRTAGKPALVSPLIHNELSARQAPGTRIQIISGIDVKVATAAQLMETSADSGGRQAEALLHKALVDDGAERCLLDQFLDAMWVPVYERTAPESEHRLYVPVPNSSLRPGVRLYLNALIERVHWDFDKTALDRLEQLAHKLHRSRWSADFEDIGPDLIRALATVNRPDLAADALGRLDDGQHVAQLALRARSHAFMARGAFVDAVNHRALALRVCGGEVEIREIIEYAILAAACGGTLGTLAAGVEEMQHGEPYKLASQTLPMHLAIAYLAGQDGLPALRAQARVLKSGAIVSGTTSIAELWLACACLSRLDEKALAARVAAAALGDPRSLLGTQKAFRASLEAIAGGRPTTVEHGAKPGDMWAAARDASRSGNLELALREFLALMDRDLPASSLVEVAQEASALFDRHARHHEELQVYARLFSSLERGASAGVERAAMRLAVNELATLKQLGLWADLVALAARRSAFFSGFPSGEVGPEAARFEWYLCHALDALGRDTDVIAQCDRVVAVCRQWVTNETDALLEQALRYKGAILSRLGREDEEAQVYMQYFELTTLNPDDVESMSSRIEVRQFLVLLLLRQGRHDEALAHMAAAQQECSSARTGLTQRAATAMSAMLELRQAVLRET